MECVMLPCRKCKQVTMTILKTRKGKRTKTTMCQDCHK